MQASDVVSMRTSARNCKLATSGSGEILLRSSTPIFSRLPSLLLRWPLMILVICLPVPSLISGRCLRVILLVIFRLSNILLASSIRPCLCCCASLCIVLTTSSANCRALVVPDTISSPFSSPLELAARGLQSGPSRLGSMGGAILVVIEFDLTFMHVASAARFSNNAA